MKLDVPVIGILRGVKPTLFGNIMEAAYRGGLQAIEVTMNTANAEKTIQTHRSKVPTGKLLGAGTVCNIEEAKRAAGAGAMFFVTPNLDTSVIEYANYQNIPIIVGALTPTEVYTGWSAGATMIKIFPCTPFGPGYIKDLLGPFDLIKLVAVGGVNSDNLKDYFAAGAKAVGVSSALFGKKVLAEQNMETIEHNVRGFIDKYHSITDSL